MSVRFYQGDRHVHGLTCGGLNGWLEEYGFYGCSLWCMVDDEDGASDILSHVLRRPEVKRAFVIGRGRIRLVWDADGFFTEQRRKNQVVQ